MVYRIPEAKPRLKGGGSVDVSEVKPALAYDSNSDIIMFSEESWLTITLSWVKTLGLFILSAMLIFTVLYGTLAASLLFATPVDGKIQVVARDTFLGGIPSKGDSALASPVQIAGDNPIDNLKEAALGVENGQVVKIISGPTDLISVRSGSFTVEGKNGGNYGGDLINGEGNRINDSFQLNRQYVGECLSGHCTPGSFVLVEETNIFGEIVPLGDMK